MRTHGAYRPGRLTENPPTIARKENTHAHGGQNTLQARVAPHRAIFAGVVWGEFTPLGRGSPARARGGVL